LATPAIDCYDNILQFIPDENTDICSITPSITQRMR